METIATIPISCNRYFVDVCRDDNGYSLQERHLLVGTTEVSRHEDEWAARVAAEKFVVQANENLLNIRKFIRDNNVDARKIVGLGAEGMIEKLEKAKEGK